MLAKKEESDGQVPTTAHIHAEAEESRKPSSQKDWVRLYKDTVEMVRTIRGSYLLKSFLRGKISNQNCFY